MKYLITDGSAEPISFESNIVYIARYNLKEIQGKTKREGYLMHSFYKIVWRKTSLSKIKYEKKNYFK